MQSCGRSGHEGPEDFVQILCCRPRSPFLCGRAQDRSEDRDDAGERGLQRARVERVRGRSGEAREQGGGFRRHQGVQEGFHPGDVRDGVPGDRGP